MDSERHIHRCGKAEPHSGLRLGRFRLKKWHQRNRTKLDRAKAPHQQARGMRQRLRAALDKFGVVRQIFRQRSEEHTSELQSLMRISYAVFCLKKKKHKTHTDRRQ